MATIKYSEIQKMSKEERAKKLKELQMELVKAKVNATKTGSAKAGQIKKIIARILTLNNSKEALGKK